MIIDDVITVLAVILDVVAVVTIRVEKFRFVAFTVDAVIVDVAVIEFVDIVLPNNVDGIIFVKLNDDIVTFAPIILFETILLPLIVEKVILPLLPMVEPVIVEIVMVLP